MVVKDGPVGATALPRTGAGVFVPALPAPVREPVGAGDAFAAGFLAGLLRGLDLPACLRLGHLTAVPALAAAGDTAPPPDPGWTARALALTDAQWAALVPADLAGARSGQPEGGRTVQNAAGSGHGGGSRG
ncbi:PfkB family carbohydrate kinase [Micromonospora chersina]|uniref:PfkB family carbohydrate kinase n=1 Tax=Micromonospora chersina TaxID=47854 RepID=UPI0033A9184D